MQTFREITPEELQLNPFKAIGKDWMLVTAAKKDGGANPMTASWGGLGILWGKPVAFVFLRPQRLTRELVDADGGFSLAFLDEGYRKQLGFCGANSGRDVDKTTQCGFTVAHDGAVPYLEQAHTVLICNKLYRQPLEPGCFEDDGCNREFYPQSDHHILYVAGIEKILVK